MPERDPRVDAYIAKAAPFAQPLLTWLRDTLHASAPGLQEDMKWSMPFFTFEGRNIAHMAAFKAHCGFGFWKGRDVADTGKEGEAMGQFGRIASKADLPTKAALKAMVKEALARAHEPAAPVAKKPAKPVPAMPADLAEALAAKGDTRGRFDALAPSHRREFLEWVLDAKRPETRAKRVAATVLKVAAGAKRPV